MPSAQCCRSRPGARPPCTAGCDWRAFENTNLRHDSSSFSLSANVAALLRRPVIISRTANACAENSLQMSSFGKCDKSSFFSAIKTTNYSNSNQNDISCSQTNTKLNKNSQHGIKLVLHAQKIQSIMGLVRHSSVQLRHPQSIRAQTRLHCRRQERHRVHITRAVDHCVILAARPILLNHD